MKYKSVIAIGIKDIEIAKNAPLLKDDQRIGSVDDVEQVGKYLVVEGSIENWKEFKKAWQEALAFIENDNSRH